MYSEPYLRSMSLPKLILEKSDFPEKKVDAKVFTYLSSLDFKKKPTFIIDVHNTTKNPQQQLDSDVSNLITHEIRKFNVIFLSYDGNSERIENNEILLNTEVPSFQNIPKIFTKQRSKGYIMAQISSFFTQHIGFDKRYKYQFIFIDDNIINIKDAMDHARQIVKLYIFHYTRYIQDHNENNDLHTILDEVPFITTKFR